MKIHLAEIPEAGLLRRLTFRLAAMTRLGEVVGPQEGQLHAEVLIKNRDGNVEIEGRVQASLQAPCQRCLEPVSLEIDDPVRVALVSERTYDDAPDEAQLGQGDLELSFYQDEELDLSHILEDELLLLIPEPIAEEDDEGRCVICGRRTDELFPEEGQAAEDHPFAQLRRLIHTD